MSAGGCDLIRTLNLDSLSLQYLSVFDNFVLSIDSSGDMASGTSIEKLPDDTDNEI